ncbi:hypothetical protein ASD32_04945 [Rhizobium sp. Root483D2]|nr:hypothetical protein ASD32_04945 [Rhizobium sp. Root483D2]
MKKDFDVRALRERIGWGQDKLAAYLRVDRSSVSHYENGRPLRGPVLRLLEILIEAADAGTADALVRETEAAE